MSADKVEIGPGIAADEDARVALTRFASSLTIAEQLPVTLKNGFEVEELSTNCPQCGDVVCKENTRGTVSFVFAGILMFDALAVCEKCLLCMSFNGRVKPAGTAFELETVQQGRWVRYRVEVPLLYKTWIFVRDQWRKIWPG